MRELWALGEHGNCPSPLLFSGGMHRLALRWPGAEWHVFERVQGWSPVCLDDEMEMAGSQWWLLRRCLLEGVTSSAVLCSPCHTEDSPSSGWGVPQDISGLQFSRRWRSSPRWGSKAWKAPCAL